HVITELGDDEGPALGALQGNDDIRLVAGQTHRPGKRQQVQVEIGVALAEFAELAGHQHGAVALGGTDARSEEHTSELQSSETIVCRLLLENKNGRARES